MKTKLFFILLLVGLCSNIKAQKGLISIINYPDTIHFSDTLIIEVQSAVKDNGNPASPLISLKDTLSGNTLSFDLTFDFTGPCGMCSWGRIDTLYYFNLPQQDSLILTCYYNYVDSNYFPPILASRIDTASVIVHIRNITGVEESKNSAEFNLYPNPSNGSLEISLKNAAPNIYHIRVFDLLGHLVHAEEIMLNTPINHKVDLGHLKKGMYLVSLVNEKEKLTKKIVLK